MTQEAPLASTLSTPTNTGMVWWESLKFEEKLAELEPYLATPGWTNKRISKLFGIDLVSVARARTIRKKLRDKQGGRQTPTDNGEANSTERKRLQSQSEPLGNHFPKSREQTGNPDHPSTADLEFIKRSLYPE